jgi:predicted nucleotidyltransferase/DNA-binding XRE family transcriptional regulator
MRATSGALLRGARERAELTQTELAWRAGVAQSMISAYENNRREPTYSTLLRLLEATGHAIEVVPLAVVDPRQSGTLRELRRHRRRIVSLLERGGAHHPRVFGSVARGTDTPGESDIDLMVDLDPDVGLVKLIALERELSELLGRSVDLVPVDSLKVGVRDQALAESVAL